MDRNNDVTAQMGSVCPVIWSIRILIPVKWRLVDVRLGPVLGSEGGREPADRLPFILGDSELEIRVGVGHGCHGLHHRSSGQVIQGVVLTGADATELPVVALASEDLG